MFGSDFEGIAVIFGVIAGITLFVLALVFVAVPLFKGIGWSIGAIFKGAGWLIMHVFEFVSGVLGDALRFIGSLLVMLVLLPMVPLNIVIGRWSAAGHFATRFRNEIGIGAACVYRAVIRRPLKFLLLDGVLEGLEQRLPEAMAGAPGADLPSRRTGQFDGYTIIGSLKAGGSGARLYVAEPMPEKRRRFAHMPDRVVIKAFALTEGSSLPQIVRESRALECAKQLGHVLDHGMDDHRFFYVMPYHPGEHLGVLTRQFHAECGSRGLDRRRLSDVMSYTRDLLATLSAYHQGGLWHKDVKPENVIVHDGRAHLVDLGLVTPLRSAMTLTTHGTEYFRDPEMVRQALRGVKVHQVDGAKFDIYAVGAVLYFMIENTFPAHGGLSRITQSCPEALRWIVRRAMTEYHQRYAAANDMLADLVFVMQARDPFAIKPAELPSMVGSPNVEAEPQRVAAKSEDHVAAAVSAAGAAVASAMSAVQAALGGRAAAKVATTGAAAAGADEVAGGASDVGRGSKSPRIVVTNWWTGEYRVEGDPSAAAMCAAGAAGAAGVAESVEARMFRNHAAGFRHQASDWRQQVRAGTLSARKAAKEQLRTARERAKEMRARAMAHRQRINGSHVSVSPWLFVLGFISVALIVGALALAFTGVRAVRSSGSATVATVIPSSQLRPVLLVVDGGDLSNSRVKQRVDRIVAERRRRGYDVVTSMAEDANLRTLINQWWNDRSGPADAQLEDIMERENAYGILHVTIKGDSRRPVKDVHEQLVTSTRPGAADRRTLVIDHLVPKGPAPQQPFLLINDHPAKTDPRVEKVIKDIEAEFARRGWSLRTVDSVEVQVRRLLPPGSLKDNVPVPPMLRDVLEVSDFGGVVRIDAAAGDGPPQQRVIVTVVRGEDIPSMPMPAAAADLPEPPQAPEAPADVALPEDMDEADWDDDAEASSPLSMNLLEREVICARTAIQAAAA